MILSPKIIYHILQFAYLSQNIYLTISRFNQRSHQAKICPRQRLSPDFVYISYIMQGTNSKIEQQAPVQLKPKVNPELVKKYREMFDSFDKEQDGYVQAKDVPGILRILGVTMTEQEVVDSLGDRAIKSDNPLISSKIDFAHFLGLIVDKESEMTMKEELMESFRVFDVDRNGMLPISELRFYLRSYGVPMSEEEVEQLLKQSEPEDGFVKYEKFIDKMLDKV